MNQINVLLIHPTGSGHGYGTGIEEGTGPGGASEEPSAGESVTVRREARAGTATGTTETYGAFT